MADKPGTVAPAVPFSGDRGPRAHVDRLDEAEDILGKGRGPVYEVKVSQWGHDQHHYKRGELLREDDLADHYNLKWALDNGTIEPASGEVSARLGVRKRSKRDEEDEEESPYAAAEEGDPDDEGAHPNANREPGPTRRREQPFAAAERTDPDDEGAKPKLDPDDARVRAEQGLMPASGHDPATGIHTEQPQVAGSTGHSATTEPKAGGPSTGHAKR